MYQLPNLLRIARQSPPPRLHAGIWTDNTANCSSNLKYHAKHHLPDTVSPHRVMTKNDFFLYSTNFTINRQIYIYKKHNSISVYFCKQVSFMTELLSLDPSQSLPKMVTGWKTYLLMLSMAALLILSYRLIFNLQKIYTQIYKFLPLVIYQIKWPSNLKPYHFQNNPKQPNLQPTEYVTPTLWPVAEFYQQK